MKRLIYALSIALLAVIAVAPFYSSPVSAAPEDNVANCYQRYNGKSFKIGSTRQKEYAQGICSGTNQDPCSKTNVKRDGADFIKITCKQAASEEADTSADTSSTASTGSGESGAVSDPALDEANQCTKDSCDIIEKFINPAIQLMTALVGIAVVIGIIWGGIQVSTSAGDPQKTASGKDHIRNAIIALVAYAVLFAFLQFIIPGGVL